MGKKERLLSYLREYGSITSFEAFEELFDTRLSDTIYRLEKDGYCFKRIPIVRTNWRGEKKYFYKYVLEDHNE